MTDDEQFMIECITTELTEYVMRDYHIGMKEALDMFIIRKPILS